MSITAINKKDFFKSYRIFTVNNTIKKILVKRR